MVSDNDSTASWKKLLIVRLGSMGDIVHTLTAATALRQAFPQALIGWVIEERWAELLCTLPTPRSGPPSPERPLVDKVHTVDTRRWRKAPFSTQTWEQMAAGLSELRAPDYEVAVDFQGAIRSSLIARWSGAAKTYGFMQPWENAASMLYSRRAIARGEHIVEQNLSLAEAVARMPLAVPRVQFPRSDAAERECECWLRQNGLGKFAVLNPGAGWGAKQWPAEYYGEVSRQLAADGVKSIINYGPGEEELARSVEEAARGGATGVSASLTRLISLTRRASLFVGGDTGPMHLAAALGVPVVAIFGPTNPARNGPFGTRSAVLRSPASSTSHKRVSAPDPGLLEISPAQVVSAARELLRGCGG